MLLYRSARNDQRPMQLLVSREIYHAEWKACWKDPARDVSSVLQMTIPFFEHLERQLRDPCCNDIQLVTLCRFLDPEIPKALDIIERWLDWADEHSSVRHEMILTMVDCIRKLPFFTAKDGNMAEWIITLDFRRRFYRTMRFPTRRAPRPEGDGQVYTLEIPVEDYHPDYLLEKNLQLSAMELYLVNLIQTGCTKSQIKNLTHQSDRQTNMMLEEFWFSLEKKC